MNSQEVFTRGLELIRSLAGKKGGSVSVADILSAFPSVELSAEQIGEIYEYLDREGIKLADYVPHDTRTLELGEDEAEAALSEEDRKMLDFYLEDLEAVRPLTGTETQALAGQLFGTEDEREEAISRLTEGNLYYTVSLAREFAGRGMPLIDLIQEANVSLMEQLAVFTREDGELMDFLEKNIRKALRAQVKEEESFARMQEDMTNAANRILELVKEREAEEGRALSAQELAERLGMPVKKVEEVLQESARAIRNAEK